MLKEIIIPDLGEGIDSVEVGEINIKRGDRVELGDIPVVLESDKASMEIEAELAGTIKDVRITTGLEVSTNTILATIEADETEEEINPEPEIKAEKNLLKKQRPNLPLKKKCPKRLLKSLSPSGILCLPALQFAGLLVNWVLISVR